mgnify:CR=1 FL=1
MKKISLIFLFMVVLSSFAFSTSFDWVRPNFWIPLNGSTSIDGNVNINGNLTVTGNYVNITVVDFNVTNNVSAEYFFGDGSYLTGINGSGTSDHSLLTNLTWSSAGHTFDTNLDVGSYNISSSHILSDKAGIGTTSPSAFLEVQGTGGTDTFKAVHGSNGGNVLNMGYSGGNRYQMSLVSGAAILYMYDDATSNKIRLATTQDSYILNNNFGLGTSSPSEKLSVIGNIYSSGNFTNLGNIQASGTINSTSDVCIVGGNCLSDSGSLWTQTGSDIYYNTGDVGIGDSTPSYDLDVAGTIRAQDYGAAGSQNLIIGDDAYLTDIDTANTIGLYGISDSTKGVLKLGSGGPTLSGSSSDLTVSGEVRSGEEFIGTSLGDSGQFRAIEGNYGAFIRNDGADTYILLTNSGDQYGGWNSLRPFMIDNPTGDVSMGNGALYVDHGTNVRTASGVELGVGTTPTNGINIDSPGTYSDTVTSPYRDLYVDSYGTLGYVSSSERYKENVQDLTNTDWMYDLRPVTFDWKETGELDVGLIAEEVELVQDKLVSYDYFTFNGTDYNIVDRGDYSEYDITSRENLGVNIWNIGLTHQSNPLDIINMTVYRMPETVSYEKLVVPLLKEVQNLKAENDLMKTELCGVVNTFSWC